MKPATKSTRRRAFLARKIADNLFNVSGIYKVERLSQVGKNGITYYELAHKAVVQRIKDLLEKYKA